MIDESVLKDGDICYKIMCSSFIKKSHYCEKRDKEFLNYTIFSTSEEAEKKQEKKLLNFLSVTLRITELRKIQIVKLLISGTNVVSLNTNR